MENPNKEWVGEVRFWDLTAGEEKQALRGKLVPVTGLAFAPDGRTLAVSLLHKDPLKVTDNGFDPPPDKQTGVLILCELKNDPR